MDTKTVPMVRPLRVLLALLAVGLLGVGLATAASTLVGALRAGTTEIGSVTRGSDPFGSDSARSGGMPTAEDGYLADGDAVSLSGSDPAVTRLDPALREALREAAGAASEAGITLRVANGWRSPAYQSWLLRGAVQRYGSEQEAAHWVGTPTTSLHVKGEAVDIAPYAAADWLDREGAQFGLCRTYDNEPWHFELSPSAPDAGCPPLFRDPSEDPRMQGGVGQGVPAPMLWR